MKSDTPRCDAEKRTDTGAWIDLARQLERELNHALALLQAYRNEIQTAKMERTRQQQILDALNDE